MVQISKRTIILIVCWCPPFRKLLICLWFTFGCLMVPGLAELLSAHRGTLVKAGWPGYVFLFQYFCMYNMRVCTLFSFTLPFFLLLCLCSESSCWFMLICQCFPLLYLFCIRFVFVTSLSLGFDFSLDNKNALSLIVAWLSRLVLSWKFGIGRWHSSNWNWKT